MFAFVNTAMADAGHSGVGIQSIHDLWRPSVGIREHDAFMGPEGVGDDTHDPECQVDWLPLGAPLTNKVGKNFTPNFPAYPSGHATFGAAALHITRLFYGRPLGNTGPDNLFQGLTFRVRRTQWHQQRQQGSGAAKKRSQLYGWAAANDCPERA